MEETAGSAPPTSTPLPLTGRDCRDGDEAFLELDRERDRELERDPELERDLDLEERELDEREEERDPLPLPRLSRLRGSAGAAALLPRGVGSCRTVTVGNTWLAYGDARALGLRLAAAGVAGCDPEAFAAAGAFREVEAAVPTLEEWLEEGGGPHALPPRLAPPSLALFACDSSGGRLLGDCLHRGCPAVDAEALRRVATCFGACRGGRARGVDGAEGRASGGSSSASKPRRSREHRPTNSSWRQYLS